MKTNSSVEVIPKPSSGGGLFELDPGLMIWSWISFFLLLIVLGKFTWKPILRRLEERENKIRDSLSQSEIANKATEEAEMKAKKIVSDARIEVVKMINEAKIEAKDIAQKLKEKTAHEIALMKKESEREMENEKLKALMSVKSEVLLMVDHIVNTILEEKIDEKKASNLIDRSLNNFQK